MDVLGERLERLEPGKAIFAHLLLPHDPYIFDENCKLKSDFELWMPHESALWWYQVKSDPQRRLARYDEYYKQVTCLHRKMGALLDSLAQRGILDQATVIIHGDHGSRISMIEAITGSEHLMTPRDIIDSVSTVFAIRGAGIEPGAVDGQHSIQALFAELALGRDDITDHNDIFLKSQQNLIGPDQTRLPMVPFH
jgi:arylsulfatase A-like enzyme